MTDEFTTSGGEVSAVRRDQWGRYLLPDPATGRERAWTRVTTFAKSIADTYKLNQWATRMAIKGVALRPDLYAIAAATPVSDSSTLNKLAEDAKDAASARAGANLGTALHAFMERLDKDEIGVQDVPEQWRPFAIAYAELMTAAGLYVAPDMIERIVITPEMGTAGTFDRIVYLERDLPIGDTGLVIPAGSYVMLDLKTGRDLQYGWNEIAIQLALYSRALVMMAPDLVSYDDALPKINQDWGLVIHQPSNGDGSCTLHAVNLSAGWAGAKLCAEVRSWRTRRAISHPVSLTTTQAPVQPVEPPADVVQVATRPLTYLERIGSASSAGELSEIWREANGRGEWTPVLLEAGRKRQQELETA